VPLAKVAVCASTQSHCKNTMLQLPGVTACEEHQVLTFQRTNLALLTAGASCRRVQREEACAGILLLHWWAKPGRPLLLFGNTNGARFRNCNET
jgi:hypothetical protein